MPRKRRTPTEIEEVRVAIEHLMASQKNDTYVNSVVIIMLRPPFIIEARCFVLGKTLSLSVVATSPVAPSARYQDSSNPWLANLRVRLFSVTVLTTFSGAPSGISASISRVTMTSAPTRPERLEITSSAIWPASRPTRVASSVTAP